MRDKIRRLILKKTGLRLGINKLSELSRLVYEICRREEVRPETVMASREIKGILSKKTAGYHDKFAGLKRFLLERRYPNAVREQGFGAYFSRMGTPAEPAAVYSGKFAPEAIFIERAAEKYPMASKVRELFPVIEPEIVEDLKSYRKKFAARPFDPRKRDLVVAVERWDFVKPCPCTKNVVNCGYHVINLGFGCPYDCSYCFLQEYSNCPGIVLYANINDYLEKIGAYLKKRGGSRIRIGTGEFTDSLALDHITQYSRSLVPFFARQNAVLELKTKSSNVAGLVGLEHGGNTVVSWSLNPEKIAAAEELGAATPAQRLQAAKKCRGAGYGVGFHFDPVIHYEGWEKDYEGIVNEMFDAVADPEWISLGTLRFHRGLKNVIEARFPKSSYIYGELIPGADRKMRYYSSLRLEIFNKMQAWIRKRNKNTAVYLCMEGPDMWRETLGRAAPRFF